MTDVDSYSALREMFSEVNQHVGEFNEMQDITAEEAISHFTADTSGRETAISALLPEGDDFEVTHEPVSTVKDWDDPWPVSYGVDGSTTQALTFNNGLVIGASIAKIGVSGETDKANLSKHSTATLVAHLNDEEFDLSGVDTDSFDLPPTVDAYVFQFPPCERTNRIDEYLVAVSRTYAEGKHAQSLAPELDGPLFIDGPIYPNPTFGWMLFEQAGVGPRHMTDVWPDMVSELLQNYVDTVEIMFDNDAPVIGITKTSGSSNALDELERKVPESMDTPLPWTSDHQLFSDALFTSDDKYGDRGSLISYTPWLFQERQSAHHGEFVVPFQTYTGIDLEYPAKDYQRAFFYVRTPMTDHVMRIECPRIFVETQAERDEVQQKALLELAMQRKEPRAITHADDQARITREDRERLRSIMGAVQKTDDYNEHRGYDDFEE